MKKARASPSKIAEKKRREQTKASLILSKLDVA